MAELQDVAFVLVGGPRTRVGPSVPERLVDVPGEPIIGHTAGVLQAPPLIDETSPLR